jgi:hypothetical protein
MATDDDLVCAFRWLLWRPEQELHLAAPSVSALDNALIKLGAKLANSPEIAVIDQLKRSRSASLPDGRRLTGGSLRPRSLARPNGACCLIWGDSAQAVTVEKALGAVGAICVLPWVNQDLATWVAGNGAAKVNCDDPAASSTKMDEVLTREGGAS